MKKQYKIVISPFLKDERIFYRQVLSDQFLKKYNDKKILVFRYNKCLDCYILIGSNFSLKGIDKKLSKYFESGLIYNV